MFSIIGIVVVFGAVVAGYLMEHGNLKVLMQPAELIIILGAAIGTVLIANPLYILTKIGSGIGGAFGGSPFNKQRYPDDAIEKHGVHGRTVRVLQKPFTHESLAQSVREALGPVAQTSVCGFPVSIPGRKR
jgi:flagellar motor component MotA